MAGRCGFRYAISPLTLQRKEGNYFSIANDEFSSARIRT